MATYGPLTGSGTQTLSAGVGALHVHINALPSASGSGAANPANRYGCGLIRAGDASAWWSPMSIAADDTWLGLPTGTTRIAYAIPTGGSVTVTEVIGASPFVGPAGPSGPAGATGPTGPAGPAGSFSGTLDTSTLPVGNPGVLGEMYRTASGALYVSMGPPTTGHCYGPTNYFVTGTTAGYSPTVVQIPYYDAGTNITIAHSGLSGWTAITAWNMVLQNHADGSQLWTSGLAFNPNAGSWTFTLGGSYSGALDVKVYGNAQPWTGTVLSLHVEAPTCNN